MVMSSCKVFDIEGLAALYDELVFALSATIDSGSSSKVTADTAKPLAHIREKFNGKCNDLATDLVALQQALIENSKHCVLDSQQMQLAALDEAQPSRTATLDTMEVDGQQQHQGKESKVVQQQSAALAHQHHLFLQRLQPTPTGGEHATTHVQQPKS